jgi:tetratricopeptide (TPR) repeat protein
VPDESSVGMTQAASRRGARFWLPPLGIALVAVSLLLVLVLSGVRTSARQVALATPTVPGVVLPFTSVQIAQFRAAAETANDFDTWRALGNAIFDNMQTLRENAPLSPQYRNMLDDWLDAAAAYERALQFRDDDVVRSDRALSLFNYGIDSAQPRLGEQAIAEVERGIARNDSSPRALINYGIILASADSLRTDEAIDLWQRVVDESPASPEAPRAEALIQSYARE